MIHFVFSFFVSEVLTGARLCRFVPSGQRTDNLVTLRLDGIDGPVIGTVTIDKTGSIERYRTFKTKVKNAAGIHDLYLCFSAVEDDTRLDWWQFAR